MNDMELGVIQSHNNPLGRGVGKTHLMNYCYGSHSRQGFAGNIKNHTIRTCVCLANLAGSE